MKYDVNVKYVLTVGGGGLADEEDAAAAVAGSVSASSY
jgi:hypothetical protein